MDEIVPKVPMSFRPQKKAWHFSPSLVVLRSSTTYNSQLQRVKPTPIGGSVAALLWELFLKVSKFQNNQRINYFAFFLFYGARVKFTRFNS